MATSNFLKRLEEFVGPMSDNVPGMLCRNSSKAFTQALKNGISWAVRMYDSSAKIQTGLLSGNVHSLGSYDECLNVVAIENVKKPFIGQHCLAMFRFGQNSTGDMVGQTLANVLKKENEIQMGLGSMFSQGLRWGFCIPSTCTPDDLTAGLKSFVERGSDVDIFVTEEDCNFTKQSPFNRIDVATISICVLLVAFVLLCTGVDFVIGYFGQRNGAPVNQQPAGDNQQGGANNQQQGQMQDNGINPQDAIPPAGGNEEVAPPAGGNPQVVVPPAGGNLQEVAPPAGGNLEVPPPAEGNPVVVAPPAGDNPEEIAPPAGGNPEEAGGNPEVAPPAGENPEEIAPPAGGNPEEAVGNPEVVPPAGGNPEEVAPPVGENLQVMAGLENAPVVHVPEPAGVPQGLPNGGFNIQPEQEDEDNAGNNEEPATEATAANLCLYSAFSLIRNGQALLRFNNTTTTLHTLYGMKFIALCWVLLAHTFLVMESLPSVNYIARNDYTYQVYYVLVYNILLAVDVFIFVSSILNSYNFMNDMKKRGIYRGDNERSKLTWKFCFKYLPVYYFHRFIRLTPVLALVVLFHTSLISHFGSGPLWTVGSNHLTHPCRDSWWGTLTYSQNYINKDEMCVPHSWYLMVDMQLTLLSPVLLVLFLLFGFQGVFWIFLAMFSVNFGLSFPAASMLHETPAVNSTTFSSVRSYGGTYYSIETHYMLGPWILGLWLGYVLHRVADAGRNGGSDRDDWKSLPWFLALISVVINVSRKLIFQHSLPDTQDPLFWYSLYEILCRVAWQLSLAWAVFQCETKNGSFVESILSLKIFQPLSRLGFNMYLVYLPLMICQAFATRSAVYVNGFYFLSVFLSNVVMSTVLALFLTLFVEMPFISLYRKMAKKYKCYLRCTDAPAPVEVLGEQDGSDHSNSAGSSNGHTASTSPGSSP